jgi:hypothetical protein
MAQAVQHDECGHGQPFRATHSPPTLAVQNYGRLFNEGRLEAAPLVSGKNAWRRAKGVRVPNCFVLTAARFLTKLGNAAA